MQGDFDIQGLKELTRKIGKLGDFPKDMRTELFEQNMKMGRVVARILKKNLPSKGTEFVVYKRRRRGKDKGPGTIEKTIPAGTLRRSIRPRKAKGSKVNVLVGPLRGGKSVRYDGYFAHMVEDGFRIGFTGKRSIGSRFYKKMTPTLSRIQPQVRRLQLASYKRIYGKWIKKL
jgi:hypothetical protein